jgi:[ribosomal protein S18]-alanine N-acetyltransferase
MAGLGSLEGLMLVVEPVRNTDVDPVARLAVQTLQERYTPEWLAEHANLDNGTFLVARDIPTNQVVGFALAKTGEAEGHLLALAVDAQRRGQGIGRALLADVREHMRRQGAMRLKLDVRWDDPSARRFYARQGFAPAGIKEGVYSDGADALEMAKPL